MEFVHHAHHGSPVDPVENAIGCRASRCDPQPLTCQATLAEEVTHLESTDNCFLASSRSNCELHFASTEVEYRIRSLALAEDVVPCAAFYDCLHTGDFCEDGFPIGRSTFLSSPENLHLPTKFPLSGNRDHGALLSLV